MKKIMLAAIAALALTLPAVAADKKMAVEPGKMTNGMLTDNKGMTLYTFDKDAANSGKSVCNGPCVKVWPPLSASKKSKAAGDWSVVTRDDGKMQWAFKGKPVYRFSKDKKAGETAGDGFKDIWHVVK